MKIGRSKVRSIALGVAACLFTLAHAQTAYISNVTRFNRHGTGFIRDKDNLIGYYSFLQVDMVDHKTNAYVLRLMDNNLNVVKDVDMQRPNTEKLLEMTYNGDRFCLLFLDVKKKSVTLETYDRAGMRTGRADLGSNLKYEMYRVEQYGKASEDGEVNETLFALGDGGFMKHLIMKDEKIGFQLLAYDNDLQPTWKYEASDPKLIFTADVVAVGNDYVVASTTKQKGLMAKPDFADLLVIDAKTGTKVFEKELSDPSGNMSVLNAFVDEDKDEITVIGEYFDKDDNIISDRSKGLYVAIYDASGERKTLVRYDWENDVSKFVPPKKNGDKEVGLIQFHRAVKGNDGSLYLIGEQFKKSFNPLMGGDALVKIDDMVVVSLDPNFALVSYQVIDKGRSAWTVPGGLYVSGPALAKFVKVLGGFDYAFTVTDKAKDRWFCTYIDFSREKGDDGKKIGTYVGTIVCDKGTITTDKIPANTKRPFYFSVLPGKPGSILIFEYDRKKMRVDYRLEKVNF